MKKRISAIVLVFCILLAAGCSNVETSISETQEASIYVERNDMAFGTDSEAEQSDESDELGSVDASTDEPSSTENPKSETGNGNVPTTTTPLNNTTGNPTPTEKEPDSNVYNTTVDIDTEETQASFGKIRIVHYKTAENNISEDDADARKRDDNLNRSGTGRYFSLGDSSYGFYRDNLLATNGATFTEDPFKVSIAETSNNPYAFNFVGAGHYLKRESENSSSFWLELERNGEVLTHTAIGKITPAGGYSVAVKGIAVKLGEFNRVKTNGNADYNPEVSLTFFITLPNGTEHEISVGTPYQSLVDILGEGTKMTGKIIVDEETGKEEEVTYYVYKTADYTLIVEKQDYPDIKPEKYQIEEGVSEETVLIKTIFLIKNEAELPPEPEED